MISSVFPPGKNREINGGKKWNEKVESFQGG
jgi:hypothetical protein